MDEYECEYKYRFDLENHTNNFDDNIVCYNDVNSLHFDRTFNNFENDLFLTEEAIEEGKEEEYLFSLNNNIALKNEKKINNYTNENSIFKKRKICNELISNNKKGKINEKFCVICLKNEKKYKFTCCYEYYCSKYCFGKHNKNECLKKKKKKLYEIESANNTENFDNVNNNSQFSNKVEVYESNENYTEDYFLTEEQKSKLNGDMVLKVLLKNKYVRSVFKQFTLSNDKISYLSHYINDPEIIQVIDQIMKTIDN